MFHSESTVLKLFVFSLSAFIFSCSSGRSEKKLEDVTHDYTEYVKASCAYEYGEGDSAVVSDSKRVVDSYFGKRYDEGLLTPVLAASAAELVRFAESKTRVHFYKTKAYQPDSCGFANSLPSAPTDLEENFARFAKEASVLGLYNRANTPGLPSTTPDASIIVRADSNKWILIHEYMHHLFHSQLDKDRPDFESDLQGDFGRTSKDYKNAKKELDKQTSDRKDKVKVAKEKLHKLAVMGVDILKVYFLEEMAIEGVLGDLMDDGQLKVVHSAQRINGAGYILTSAKTAEGLMEEMKNEIEKFQTLYKSDLESTDNSQFTSVLNKYEDLSKEMQTLKRKARHFLSEENLTFNGLMPSLIPTSDDANTSRPGCNHHELSPKVREVFEKLGSDYIYHGRE